MFGWFGAALLAVAGIVLAQSDVRPAHCEYFCFSIRETATIIAVAIGVPGTIIGLITSGHVLRRLHRKGNGGVAAGTSAGLVGLAVGTVVTVAGYALVLSIQSAS